MTILLDKVSCSRCGAAAHDLADEATDRRGNRTWLLQCVFCGGLDRIDAPATTPEPVDLPPAEPEVFRFKHGRFTGMTLAEADAQPNGRRYLEWMLKNNKTLASRVAAYLRASTA